MCDAATDFDGVRVGAFAGPRTYETGAALILEAGIGDEVAAAVVDGELADGGEVRRATRYADDADSGA